MCETKKICHFFLINPGIWLQSFMLNTKENPFISKYTEYFKVAVTPPSQTLLTQWFWFFPSYLLEFVTSGPVVAMELKGSNAIEKWRTLLGPTDSATARNKAPMSIRAKFGTGKNLFEWH